MSEYRILAALRKQAWERAKGELMAMDHTYYDEGDDSAGVKWREFDKIRNEFIKHIEYNGLHE